MGETGQGVSRAVAGELGFRPRECRGKLGVISSDGQVCERPAGRDQGWSQGGSSWQQAHAGPRSELLDTVTLMSSQLVIHPTALACPAVSRSTSAAAPHPPGRLAAPWSLFPWFLRVAAVSLPVSLRLVASSCHLEYPVQPQRIQSGWRKFSSPAGPLFPTQTTSLMM